MNTRKSFEIISILTVLILSVSACGGSQEAAEAPSDSTEAVAEAPNATPVPPTATPVPPTATPVSPTNTPVPPTDTPTPPAAVEPWEEFASDEFGFSVLVPETPVESSQTIEAAGEGATMTLFSVEGQHDTGTEYAYLVSHMPFPAIVNAARDEQIEQLLDDTRDGVISGLQATVVEEVDQPLDSHPGREVELETAEFRMIYRFILADANLYQVVVGIDKAAEFSEDDFRFLESFTLLEPVAGAKPAAEIDEAVAAGDEAEVSAAEWQEFSSTEGNFSVLMPAAPEETTQPIVGQDTTISIFLAADETSRTLFMVIYNDFPEGLFQDASDAIIETALDQGRDGGLANVDGILVSEESIELDGYPGREIVFKIPESHIPGGGEGVAQFYLVDNRLYQLLVMGPKGGFAEEDVDRFLDSFQFLE